MTSFSVDEVSFASPALLSEQLKAMTFRSDFSAISASVGSSPSFRHVTCGYRPCALRAGDGRCLLKTRGRAKVPNPIPTQARRQPTQDAWRGSVLWLALHRAVRSRQRDGMKSTKGVYPPN